MLSFWKQHNLHFFSRFAILYSRHIYFFPLYINFSSIFVSTPKYGVISLIFSFIAFVRVKGLCLFSIFSLNNFLCYRIYRPCYKAAQTKIYKVVNNTIYPHSCKFLYQSMASSLLHLVRVEAHGHD